jgi:hypothetical protein
MSSEPDRSRSGLNATATTTPDGEWTHDEPISLLDALGDRYTRAAFETVLDGPKSGRAVAVATGMSRATAFRRLNALADLGLLDHEP